MAVYKRKFKTYDGPETRPWSRFLIFPRYAYKDVFASKLVTAFFVLCFFLPLAAAVVIYLRYNVSAMEMLQLPINVNINETFFLSFLYAQGFLAFVLTVIVGPGLVSGDLSNNALPLYLCRPLTRAEYVLGKMSVLMVLLSLITWVPGLILFILQASLAGMEWLGAHWWIASSLVIGSAIWILVLSLLSLAISAWFRWKPVAAAALVAVFFVAGGVGQTINQVLDTEVGNLLDLLLLILTVWANLFGDEGWTDISVPQAWIALIVVCLLCLWILSRKLRAYEVVK